MEVHHRPQTPRKKWTHYFWEFLMLFFAVFCGFLAENQREHFIEHKREKQYVRSLVRDVATDTSHINELIFDSNLGFKSIQKTCDSLLVGFAEYSTHFTVAGERQMRWLLNTGFPDFIYTDRTMQQLKNAGGLRLIRNLTAADSIISYDAAVRDIFLELESLGEFFSAIRNFRIDNFSMRRRQELSRDHSDAEIEKMKISLWTGPDAKASDKLYNLIRIYRGVIESRIDYLIDLKFKGIRLIEVLKKEYRLK
jgi:hypothetical protein